MELGSPNNGESPNCSPAHDLIGNSNSSPGQDVPGGYFFSCPASPVHYVLSSPPYSFSSDAAPSRTTVDDGWSAGPFEFDGTVSGGTMTSADELFLDGQIRPLRISSHLLRPQRLAPLLDRGEEEGEMTAEEEEDGRWRGMRTRSRSLHRRTRSMSPLRSPRFQWQEEKMEKRGDANGLEVLSKDPEEAAAAAATTPESAPSSRSSSSSSGSRSSKRWIFLKDLLLHRSKSEGSERGSGVDKDKFWRSISFSPSAKPKPQFPSSAASTPASAASSPAAEQIKPRSSKRPTNGVATRRRRPPASPPLSLSLHERHYTVLRAQAEEMRRRTFLTDRHLTTAGPPQPPAHRRPPSSSAISFKISSFIPIPCLF